jgi:hypothetical protein
MELVFADADTGLEPLEAVFVETVNVVFAEADTGAEMSPTFEQKFSRSAMRVYTDGSYYEKCQL